MNFNVNSHFSKNPQINHPRSVFDMGHDVLLTCNVGDLVPWFCEPVLPGDTWDCETALLARMQTLTVPLLQDLFVDLAFFYVPNRLLWKHWVNLCGENDEPWYDDTEYSVPMIKFLAFNDANYNGKAQVKPGSVADYLNIPYPNGTGTYSGVDQLSEASHLPFRAYCKIWNDWYRNENIQGMAAFNMEDANVTMDNTDEAWYGGNLLPVTRFKDYFSSVLPNAQRGPSVTIGVADAAPVFTTGSSHSYEYLKQGADTAAPLRWEKTSGNAMTSDQILDITAHGESQTAYTQGIVNSSPGSTRYSLMPSNLWADLSAATGISINQLRTAFATQHFYEHMARSGARYTSVLSSMFGVENPDARLQRAELLGYQRLRVNINQVVQQSETGTTPLGNVGAYSLTTDDQDSFHKSFTEFGYIIGVLCIRYPHSYNQGLPRHFSQKNKFDFYWPDLANIGEQPVLNKEIYMDGSSKDDEVFGYQEAWSFYRYQNNILLGEMRTNHPQTLDYWHLGDNYESRPYYSEEWIVENKANVDRALAVQSNVSNQFMIALHPMIKATRPMPVFSIPGLNSL